MLKLFLVAIAMVWSVADAVADGFQCQSQELDLKIAVYNYTHRSEGTRKAAVMIVSDTSIESPNRTIAVFRNTLLSSKSLRYTAKVDMRFRESSRGGELIAGTTLRELKSIQLVVDFVYGQNLASGEDVDAMLYLDKRDGERMGHDMICSRYLKN
jgi:hypothetical protein